MSTDAKNRRQTQRRVAWLAFLLLGSCVNIEKTAGTDFDNAFTEVVLRRDFDAVYPLVRAEMNREALAGTLAPMWISSMRTFGQRVGQDDYAAFRTGWLLAGGFEYITDPRRFSTNYTYNEKLREPSLVKDRFRAAVVWLRRAVDWGVLEAGWELGTMYRDVRSGLPRDEEVARCFFDASRSRIVMTVCRHLEQAKGYDPGS